MWLKLTKDEKGSKNNIDNFFSKKIVRLCAMFTLVIVTLVTSYAFFSYSKIGDTTATITSGDIEFSFIEGESAGLASSFPLKDEIGANDTTEEYTFTVNLKSSSKLNKMNYNVYLLDANDDENTNYFTNNQIKFALLKNDVFVAGTSETTGIKLSELPGFDEEESKGEGLVLEDQEITPGVTDSYKLRIWISDDVNYSNTEDTENDSQTSIGKYNGYKYSLKVKVSSAKQTSIVFGNIAVSKKTMTAEISDPNGLDAYAVTKSSKTPEDSSSEWIGITSESVGNQVSNNSKNVIRTNNTKVISTKIIYDVEDYGVYYLHVRNNINQTAKKSVIFGKGSKQTIYFDSNGGNPITTTNVTAYNDIYGELPIATRNGYIFIGWYTASTGGQAVTSDCFYSDVLANTLYARWQKNKYTLMINPNEGTYEDSTGEANYILEYQEEKNIPNPTRVGYTFDKWTVTGVESSLTNGIFKMGYENATLKANWNINSYTLTVNPDGGTWNNSSSSQNFTLEYKSTKDIPNPTKDGHTFTGWEVVGENAELNSTTFTIGNGNATLKATWEVNDYKYITKHYQQNVTADGYTLIDADTKEDTGKFGTQVTPPVNTYTGFTSPSPKTLTITSNELANLVEYQYSRNKYTLTVNPNGGTYNNSTSNTTSSMYYGASQTINNPTKTGYSFSGWTISSGKMTDKVFTMATSNATLTANYTVNKYVVTFDATVGSVSQATKEVTYDSTYGTLPTPTQPGFTFAGWYTSKSGGFQVISSTKVTITSNQTLYARWTRNSYTLSVDPNGGTWNGSTSITTKTLGYGDTLAIPDPTRTGYTFNNWTVSSGTLSNRVFTMGASNATLTANYSANKYTVFFNAYGGSVSQTLKEVTYDSTYGTLPTPTRTGHTFNGWYTAMSGGSKVESSTKITITSNQTLYARWTVNNYSLTVNPNGGTWNSSTSNTTKTLAYGGTLSIPDPTRTGYTFSKWTVSSGTLSNKVFTMGASNATLTANYSANKYTVSFNANGGTTSTSSTTVTYNSTYGTLPTPSRTGYTFTGWYTSSSGGSQVTSSTKVTITSNQTLYANWQIIPYTISYNLAGGSINSTLVQSYTVDSGSITLPQPTKTGYHFIGWTGSNGSTPQISVTIPKGSTGNRTYTANWVKYNAVDNGIFLVSTRNGSTWSGALDGTYKAGDTNVGSGNWVVSVTDYCVSIRGTKYPNTAYSYQFYIYEQSSHTLLAVGAASVPGDGKTAASATICW